MGFQKVYVTLEATEDSHDSDPGWSGILSGRIPVGFQLRRSLFIRLASKQPASCPPNIQIVLNSSPISIFER